MKNLITIAFILLPVFANAQATPQWGKLKSHYAVGYKDTVIFKDDELFIFNSYKGKKPVYISIWYPAMDRRETRRMKYRDYFDLSRHKGVEAISDALKENYVAILERTGILINISANARDDRKIDALHKQLLGDVLETPVKAKKNLPAIKGKAPCVIYHHGARSAAIDNHVFGEYMASCGFMVISASYLLPADQNKQLLLPGNGSDFDLVGDFDYVVKWAQQHPDVDTANMFGAGYSLGGQILLLHDEKPGPKPFKRIFAFHTTLEDRSWEDARKHWPELKNTFDNTCHNCTTPTMIFASLHLNHATDKDTATGKEMLLNMDILYPTFEPFRRNKTTPYNFVTLIHPIMHDGFISMGNVRSPFAAKYKLPDAKEIREQQHYYEQLLQATMMIIAMDVAEFPLPVDKSLEDDFKNEQYP